MSLGLILFQFEEETLLGWKSSFAKKGGKIVWKVGPDLYTLFWTVRKVWNELFLEMIFHLYKARAFFCIPPTVRDLRGQIVYRGWPNDHFFCWILIRVIRLFSSELSWTVSTLIWLFF